MQGSSLARLEQQSRNLREMIARLGIEPLRPAVGDGGREFAEVARSCWACRRGMGCRVWLDARTGPLEAAPSFCPNAARFQAMRERR
jgi:hypothetical protein